MGLEYTSIKKLLIITKWNLLFYSPLLLINMKYYQNVRNLKTQQFCDQIMALLLPNYI